MKENFLYYLRVALLAGVLLFILVGGSAFAHPVSTSTFVNPGSLEDHSEQSLALCRYPAKQHMHELYFKPAALL